MHFLSDQRLQPVTQSLKQQRQELLAQLRRRLHQADEQEQFTVLASYAADSGLAWASQLSDTELALLNHELQELREIDDALARIAQGHYGVCEQCGQPIAYARLLVQPSARMCVHCQATCELRRATAS